MKYFTPITNVNVIYNRDLPDTRTGMVIYTDAGCITNPGKTVCGYVVMSNGRIIGRYGIRLGEGTVNTAEYYGLVCALRHCVDKIDAGHAEYANVTICMDSRLVVQSFRGIECGMKHPHLACLKKHAMGLMARFNGIKLYWVPRELNRAADAVCDEMLRRVANKHNNIEGHEATGL